MDCITRNTRSFTARKRTYRLRVKNSKCRSLGPATCRRKAECKRATGTKRAFCRKRKNTMS